jgi:hypothetical protein
MKLNRLDIKRINKLHQCAPFLKWRKRKNIYQGYMVGNFPYMNYFPKRGEDRLELRQQERILLETWIISGVWYVRVYGYDATNEQQSQTLIQACGSWIKRTVKKALKMEADFRKANHQESMAVWAAKKPNGQLSLVKQK